MATDDKFTVYVTWSPDIAEREVLGLLPSRTFRKGTDRGVYIGCRGREEADLLLNSVNSHPGVHAKLWAPA